MKLVYKILWVDDEQDFIDSSERVLKRHLDNLGYQLEITRYYEQAAGDPALLSGDWNLILMDYNLEAGLVGTELIEQIRNNEIFTEIVFYSSDRNKLNESIKTEPLEGVYWSGRTTDFDEKVPKIIDITLKKALDINNVRGLVMAEVADMDHELTDIITLHHECIPEDKQEAFQTQMLERCKEQLERALEGVNANINGECVLADCTNFRRTDSHKRYRAIKGILREENIALEANQSNTLNAYEHFLGKRNLLAHGKTDVIDGEEVVLSNEQVFKLTDTIALQRSIHAHRTNFEKIKKRIIDHHRQ